MTNRRPIGLRRRAIVVGSERLALFGDALIAIAITLFALEITVPVGPSDSEVAHAVRDAVPAIAAYLLSFAVISALWLAQHARPDPPDQLPLAQPGLRSPQGSASPPPPPGGTSPRPFSSSPHALRACTMLRASRRRSGSSSSTAP